MKKIIILLLAGVFCSTVNAELKRLKVVVDGESKTWTSRGNSEENSKRNARNEYSVESNKPVLSEPIQIKFGEKLELIDASAQLGGIMPPLGQSGNSRTTVNGAERIFLDVLLPEFDEPFEHSIKFTVVGKKTNYGGHLGEESDSNFVFHGPCTIRLGLTPRYSHGYSGSGIRHFHYNRYKSVTSATFKISDIDDSGSTGRGRNYSLVIPETTGDATLVLESSDDLVNWEVDTVGDKPKGNRKKFYRLRARQQ